MPAPLALGLTVAGLLSVFGAGAALLPSSVTGSGVLAGPPAAAAAGAADGAVDPAAFTGTVATDPGATGTPAPAGEAAPAPTKTGARPPAKPGQKSPKKPSPKTAAKPKTPTAPSRRQATEDEVTRLVNIERRKAGCGAVKTNEKLRTAMRRHVEDMAKRHYFSHDSQDGRSPWDRARAAGYDHPIGENIAKGQRTAADVMRAWMNSPGHKRNILNCSARAIGVGLAYEGSTPVWGQLFGSK